MSRIVIASDTHGRTDKLRRLQMKEQADQYWFAGDLCDDPKNAQGWRMVKGNNDAWLGTNLPEVQVIPIQNHKVFLTHGHRQGYRNRTKALAKLARENGCDIVVYGHSHRPEITEEDGILILNPGSLARPRTADGCTWMELEITPEKVLPTIKKDMD